MKFKLELFMYWIRLNSFRKIIFPLLLFILIENILLLKMNKYKFTDIELALHSFNISDTF